MAPTLTCLIDKPALLQEIRIQLEQELAILIQAAKAAHEAATHEESKPEDSHDTRGLESSYLAGAQAHRVTEIEEMLNFFRQLELKDFSESDLIAATAVVELKFGGRKTLYLIAPLGGGMRVTVGGKVIQIITPQSPVGEELIGQRVGDEIEVETQGMTREFEITAIA